MLNLNVIVITISSVNSRPCSLVKITKLLTSARLLLYSVLSLVLTCAFIIFDRTEFDVRVGQVCQTLNHVFQEHLYKTTYKTRRNSMIISIVEQFQRSGSALTQRKGHSGVVQLLSL